MSKSQSQLVSMIRSGLNLITQAISIHDQDLRLVHANQRFQKLFQLPDHLMQTGASFRDTLLYLSEQGEYGPLDDIPSFVDEKVDLALKFQPHYFERTRANGTSISVEGSPLEEGGWITVYSDITETKRQELLIRSRADSLSEELLERSADLAETNRALSATIRALEAAKIELRTSRERLELINHMTPAHIAHVDAQGFYTHSNGRLSSILPDTQSDIVGREMKVVLGPQIWSHVGPRLEKVISGTADVSEFRDAETGKYVRLAMSPDTQDDGQVMGAYILSTDVTEEVSARNALTYARRRELATQLTSAMSHDFSNLLTIIMGQQSRLDELGDLGPEVHDISGTIRSAAKRGAELVNSLNRISPELKIDPTSVNIAAFARNLEPLARAALGDSMTFAIDVALPDETLIFDPGFAQDALLNLVINASEACGGVGDVSIKLDRTSDAQLRFQVRDSGPGFETEALKNALNPFYSTKGGKVGRGLGMTSAYDFARSCQGRLRYRNHEDGGAEITLLIPYLPTTPSENGLVLLVDDSDDVRKTVRNHLRRCGHAVIEAATVGEAEQLMAIDGLTHIVTDLDIGRSGTGLDVATRAAPDIPVLIITGLPRTHELRQKAEAAHVVLGKPFDFDDLRQNLERVSV